MMIDLILIAAICVMVTDVAQFPFEIEKRFSKWLGGAVHIKLFECSLCQTWWLCILYIICTSQISILSIFLALLTAVMTPEVHLLIRKVKDIITEVISNI